MIKRRLFSIITVCKNAVTKLKMTLESVINQTIYNEENIEIEYIIIDGASTDGTVDLMKNYSGIFEQKRIDLIVVSESDNGIYDAMNKGLRLAKGEYISFLGAGDYYYSNNALSEIAKNLDNSDLIYGDEAYDFGKVIAIKKNNPVWQGFENKAVIAMPACHESIFIKSSIAKKFYFDTYYKLIADQDRIVKMVREGEIKNYKYLPITVSVREVGGLTDLHGSQVLKEFYEMWERYGIKTPNRTEKLRKLIKEGLKDTAKKLLGRKIYFYLYLNLIARKRMFSLVFNKNNE